MTLAGILGLIGAIPIFILIRKSKREIYFADSPGGILNAKIRSIVFDFMISCVISCAICVVLLWVLQGLITLALIIAAVVAIIAAIVTIVSFIGKISASKTKDCQNNNDQNNNGVQPVYTSQAVNDAHSMSAPQVLNDIQYMNSSQAVHNEPVIDNNHVQTAVREVVQNNNVIPMRYPKEVLENRSGYVASDLKDKISTMTDRRITQESNTMMFCVFCGQKIKRTVKYCNYCGNEIKYRKYNG